LFKSLISCNKLILSKLPFKEIELVFISSSLIVFVKTKVSAFLYSLFAAELFTLKTAKPKFLSSPIE